jgi:energy-coupling factor transport system ATP-binding protein
MIEISRLSARIRKTEILRDVSFSAKGSEFIALVGPNGAGKTTLLKHLNGLMKPSSGEVVVMGMDTKRSKTSRLARSVGFLFQNPDRQILCQSVRKEIQFGLKHCGVPQEEWQERIEKACRRVGILDEIEQDPFLLPRSKRQRVALASVLATEPAILVLDEPTSAQDESETLRIMDIAREFRDSGKIVILVSHDMELVARYASRVLCLIDGSLALDGRPAELFGNRDLLRKARLIQPGFSKIAYALGLTPENGFHHGSGLSAASLADLILARAEKEIV